MLASRYSRELYQFAYRVTNSSAAAEDVVQETLLRVHTAAAQFDPNRRFKPWLFTIAANKARDWLRSRSRKAEVALDAEIGTGGDSRQRLVDVLADERLDVEDPLELEERRELIRRIVDAMPPQLCEVLVLAYYHRFPYREIAEVVGIPLGTVKSRLHAAVARFAELYKAATGEVADAKDKR